MKKITKITFLAVLVSVIVTSGLFAGFFYFVNSPFKAKYYFDKAYSLDEQNPQGSVDALKYYKKAIKTYEAIGDKNGVISSYIHLGLLHFKFGNRLQVERCVLTALNLGEENIPRNLKAKAYLLIAGISEPQKSREYIDKALAISVQDDLKPQITKAYYLMGKSYEYEANFEEAEKSYLKAVKIINDYPSTAYFMDIVSLYESLGEIYIGDGKTDEAIKYYDDALAYSFKDDESMVTAHYMKVLGDLYMQKKEIKKACEFWRKSEDTYAYIGRGHTLSSGEVSIPQECKNIS